MGRLRELIPRFSLRTLVIFILLVTSGMGLWRHWEPWAVVHRPEPRSFDEGPGFDEGLELAPDGQRALLKGIFGLGLWDVSRASLIKAYRAEHGEFSRDGSRFVLSSSRPSGQLWSLCDSRTGEVLAEGHGSFHYADQECFSPDSDRFVGVSTDHAVRAWDVESGRCVFSPTWSSDPSSVTFSSDGARLLVGGEDGSVSTWSAEDGRGVKAFMTGWSPVSSLASVQNDEKLITVAKGGFSVWPREQTGKPEPLVRVEMMSCDKGTVLPGGTMILIESGSIFDIYSIDTGKKGARLDGEFYPTVYDASETGAVVMRQYAGRALVQNRETGEALCELRTDMDIQDLEISADGSRVLAIDSDTCRAEIWDSSDLKELRSKPNWSDRYLNDPAIRRKHRLQGGSGTFVDGDISLDGRRAATCGTDGRLRVWSVESGQKLLEIAAHEAPIRSVRYLPGGDRIASRSEDGTVRIWDVADGRRVSELADDGWEVGDPVFSPDGRRAATINERSVVEVYDCAAGERLLSIKGHYGTVWDASFSRDGACIVTTGGDRTARVWSASTGECLATFSPPCDFIRFAKLSPDGEVCITANDGPYMTNTLSIWERSTGRLVAEGKLDDTGSFTPVFSPDSRLLVVPGDSMELHIWDAKEGELRRTVESDDSPWGVRFIEGGKRLLYGEAEGLRVIDAVSGELLWSVDDAHVPTSNWVSPCGRMIATTSPHLGDYNTGFHEIKIWDASTFEQVATLIGASPWTGDLGWSTDGARVACSAMNGTAWAWDSRRGRLAARLESGMEPYGAWSNGRPITVGAPSFSADGRMLAVGANGSVCVFRRRRPEWWWGVFYLWELWLTAAFAGLFVWSVARDRRALRERKAGVDPGGTCDG